MVKHFSKEKTKSGKTKRVNNLKTKNNNDTNFFRYRPL